MSGTERQERNDDYEATRWPHKPPTECPNCKAPVWIETTSQTRNDGTHIRLIFECGDSLDLANGRIWKQDGSASFPHGIGCRLAKAAVYRWKEWNAAHGAEAQAIRKLREGRLSRKSSPGLLTTCGNGSKLEGRQATTTNEG